jgi:hypothetical protein
MSESESDDIMLDDIWRSRPSLMDFGEPVIPGDTLTIWRMVLPESESGMDPKAVGSKEEMTKWGLEHPEKQSIIGSMLESLELNEAEKMKAKNPMPDESISFVADAVPKAAEGGKRMKKVWIALSQEYIDYIREHPVPMPFKPVDALCSSFVAIIDKFVARQEAEYKERERILKDYDLYGYALKEYEVTDDEEEEEEEV